MAVLTVHLERRGGRLGQGGDCGRSPIDVRTRPTIERHDARKDGLVVAVDHSEVDPALLGTDPHECGIGPITEHQPERPDHHGLAGTGLAGDRRQTGSKRKRYALEHRQILDVELGEHLNGQ